MIQIIRRYWLLLILTALAVMLMLARQISTSPDNPTSLIPTPSPVIESKFGILNPTINIQYSGLDINIPESLPIYPRTNTAATELIQILINKMQLSPLADVPNLWTNQNNSLNYDPATESIIISAPQSELPTPGINVKTAVSQATRFIEDLGLSNAMINQEQILLIGREGEYINREVGENLPPEQAYFAVIPYSFKLNNFPLHYADLPSAYLSVIVTNKSVVKATINPSFQPGEPVVKKTIALEKSLDNIRSGRSAFISTDSTDPTLMSIKNMSKINLERGWIEYRFEPTTSLASPHYHFTGTGATTDNRTVKIEIITPAVDL